MSKREHELSSGKKAPRGMITLGLELYSVFKGKILDGLKHTEDMI